MVLALPPVTLKIAKAGAKHCRRYVRPSIAPKPSLDIKHIRQAPGLYEQNCIDRNYKAQSRHPWSIIEKFDRKQELQRRARVSRERNNDVGKRLASTAAGGGDGERDATGSAQETAYLMEEAKKLKDEISIFTTEEEQLQEDIENLALDLPNLSSTHTPSGETPELVRYIGDHPDSKLPKRTWRSHVDIGAELGLLDFEGAAKTSGWGWYYLLDEAAQLEAALVEYAVSVARRKGWRRVSPPSIVYSHVADACGFKPRDHHGEQQIYTLQQAEKDAAKPPLCLAGTAEIPLAGLKANQVLNEEDLPLKYIGVSRCYRAEAGARGVDTKGLYRVHEFTKVEMFAWTMPDPSSDEAFGTHSGSHSEEVFDEMVSIQSEILESLGLHCRVLEMPSTDLGASAARKHDIEAWFPSRRQRDDGYGEVTSASICTDYQSRRLATRVKTRKGGQKYVWPHTVNGTALAVPRVLAALLENGWDEGARSVKIPEALQPFMGQEKIRRR